MRPVEAVKEILKIVLIFMALLAIQRNLPSQKEPSEKASHKNLFKSE